MGAAMESGLYAGSEGPEGETGPSALSSDLKYAPAAVSTTLEHASSSEPATCDVADMNDVKSAAGWVGDGPMPQVDSDKRERHPVVTKAGMAAPKSLVCHLCGREFGTRSLAIHMKQCYRKREATQQKMKKRHQTPAPKAPSIQPPREGAPREQYEQYNEAALAIYGASQRSKPPPKPKPPPDVDAWWEKTPQQKKAEEEARRKAEEDRLKAEEEERKAKEEAQEEERKAKEEAEEAERKAKEEEEAERKAKEEAEEEEQRKAKEEANEAERKEKEEEERKAKEEEERK